MYKKSSLKDHMTVLMYNSYKLKFVKKNCLKYIKV